MLAIAIDLHNMSASGRELPDGEVLVNSRVRRPAAGLQCVTAGDDCYPTCRP